MAERPPTRKRAPPAGAGTRRRRLLQNLAAVAVAAAFVAALGLAWESEPDRPDRRSGMIGGSRDGETLYQEFCAYCHGLDLDGKATWYAPTAKDAVQAPRLDGEGNAWKLSDRSLFDITKHGGQRYAAPGVTSRMPAFDKVIDDRQIRNVIAYIKSRWPARIHAERTLRGLE